MSTKRVPFAAALLALGAGFALPQTTWHVDAGATPPGDGSPQSPYASIQYAIDQPSTVHGDTILVAPGTYVETVHYNGKRVRVTSVAGPNETFIKPDDATAPWVVFMDGDRFEPEVAVLEGFTVMRDEPPVAGRAGVRGGTGSHFQRIRRCVVRGHGDGLVIGYTGDIEECTVTQCLDGVRDGTNSKIFMQSSIVKDNQRDLPIGALGHPDIFISYSNFDPSHVFIPITGTGNINEDPRFWDAANGDFRLRPDSPCIDTGDPGAPFDPDGSRLDMGAMTYDPFHAPGAETYCFGSDAACPCGNGGSGEGGCEIAQGTGGVAIGIRDFAPDGAGGGTATIFGTNYPPASMPGVTLIRSPAAEHPPLVFGDGLRCIATAGLVRVRASLAVGGTAEFPITHGAGAGSFFYQLWNRNTPITFCDPSAAFNLSNALELVWP